MDPNIENYISFDLPNTGLNAAYGWPNNYSDSISRLNRKSRYIHEGLQQYQNVRENCGCDGSPTNQNPRGKKKSEYFGAPELFNETYISGMSCSANFGVPGNSVCQSNRVTGKQLTSPVVQSFQYGGVNAFGEGYNGIGDYQDQISVMSSR